MRFWWYGVIRRFRPFLTLGSQGSLDCTPEAHFRDFVPLQQVQRQQYLQFQGLCTRYVPSQGNDCKYDGSRQTVVLRGEIRWNGKAVNETSKLNNTHETTHTGNVPDPLTYLLTSGALAATL